MKLTGAITIFFISIIVLLQACSDNSSGSEGGEKVEVTGTINAPDGSTPLAGATVFIPERAPNKAVSVKVKGNPSAPTVTDCPEPTENYSVFTCTNADGSFAFEIPVAGGEVTLKVTKGIFSFEQNINDSGDIGEIVMPSAKESFEGEIAVVEGSYDRMQDILAKVGFGEIETDESSFGYGQLIPGTEQFDLLDSPETLFEDQDGDGMKDLFNYDIVFINCGTSESLVASSSGKVHRHKRAQKLAGNPNILSEENRTALRTFVMDGGVLYATDLSYDYIEQTFPSYVDFYGEDSVPADQPEEWNAAQVGTSGIETDGNILQQNLEDWISNVDCHENESCLNSDETIHVTDFLAGWSVIEEAHSGANVTSWIEGDVEWSGGSGIRPLTVSFSAGNGNVFYSSYHTVESEFTPNWRPQERVLQYLVFE